MRPDRSRSVAIVGCGPAGLMAAAAASNAGVRVDVYDTMPSAGLLRELLPPEDFADPTRPAAAIESLPLRLIAPRPLDEAISSAGGVALEALDERLVLRALPGVFCAGEMFDREAPTGGYLLTVFFASGRAAGTGAITWLETANPSVAAG